MNKFRKTARLAALALPLISAAGAATTPSASPTLAAAGMNKTDTYTGGTYTARGWYGSLPSSITVTVTLDHDLISTVKVQPHATDPTSLDLQKRFAAAVPGVVVGRRIADVKVGKLAGSSGTPKGFNDAIEKIKNQAK